MAFMVCEFDGYIIGIGKNQAKTGGVTEERYNSVANAIRSKPQDPDGYNYKLRADDLEWELVELPEPEPMEEYAEISDYEASLSDLGVRFGD